MNFAGFDRAKATLFREILAVRFNDSLQPEKTLSCKKRFLFQVSAR